MIEISHLVVDGCSYAYCQGLENPHIDGWPALLAKKIGVPVVNLALGGASMDAIHRRQYDYFYLSQNFYKKRTITPKPFCIISLTHATRREEFFEQYYNSQLNNRYVGLDLTPDLQELEKIISALDINPKNLPAYFEFGHFFNANLYTMTLRKLHYWDSIRQLFQNNKVNYCIFDYMPTIGDNIELLLHQNSYNLLVSLYGDKHYYGNMNEITQNYPKLPCMHDGLEAQHVVCDHIYNNIKNNYGEIVVTSIDEIYKLKNYYDPSNIYRALEFSDWFKI